MGAVADRIGPDAATFASLPRPLACLVFLALPADARGRAACVCRAWRNVLADPTLWTRLVVRAKEKCFVKALYGAARCARRQLRHLDITRQDVSLNELLPVLTANAGSLRELHLHTVHAAHATSVTYEAVLAAAPLLQVVSADYTYCDHNDAPQMLHAARLQMRHRLSVRFDDDNDGMFGNLVCFGPFAAALMDATLQPALLQVEICCADTEDPALMGALVDAAVERQLRVLMFDDCIPPNAAHLARLLTEGSLVGLEFYPSDEDALRMFEDEAGAALVADALRMNTTLTNLVLVDAELSADVGVAQLLLGALEGHPSLRKLQISGEYILNFDDPGYEAAYTETKCKAFSAALAAIIAADAPALHVFDCWNNTLGDVGLALIVEALATNSHLRELDVSFNEISEEFAREHLLPAVRANTSLRKLKCANHDSNPPAAAKAERLVRRRGQRD